MEAGYVSVEIEELQLSLTEQLSDDHTVRIDAEILDSSESFQWASSGDAKFSTSAFSPLLKESGTDETQVEGEEQEDRSKEYHYIHGFSTTFLRSTYIDLDPEVMNGLANAKIVFKVMSVNNKPQDSAPPPKKGQPPPEVKPAEEPLFTLSFPVASLLKASNCFVYIDQNFDNLLGNSRNYGSAYVNANVIGGKSSLAMKISSDNDLAEYVIGSKIFKWQGACFNAPPPQWGLHAPDAVDPKAKVQPTAEEYRAKYLENISKLVEDHSGVATYSLSVGGAEKTSSEGDENGQSGEQEEEENVSPVTSEIQRIFKLLELSNGKVSFDRAAAEKVGEEENLRVISSLWKVAWESSSVIFLHRSTVRKVLSLLKEDPGAAYLPLTVKKVPSTASSDVEGGELSATAYISLESIASPGLATIDIKASLQGESMTLDEEAAAAVTEDRPKLSFNITASFSPNLVPASAVDSFHGSHAGPGHIPDGILSDDIPSSNDPNRDIIVELRKDISSTIERIAQEYVSLYPEPLPPAPKGHVASGEGAETEQSPRGNASRAGSAASRVESAASRVGSAPGSAASSQSKPLTKEERQADFLDYLSNNGIFHELKESLKPRVQQLIRDHCGQRGRALNKTSGLRTTDLGLTNSADQGAAISKAEVTDNDIETVLSELYVFLLKECSVVLNSLFSNTIIDRDVSEFEKTTYINDEEETVLQKNARLRRQAMDAAANGNYNTADMLLLERIQLINHTSALGARPEIVHDAYADYGRFLLQQCATLLSSNPNVPVAFVQRAQTLQSKAREALKAAYDSMPDSWNVALLYAVVLIESDQEEQGEYVLHDLIKTQLRKSNPEGCFDLEGFGDFDGYESDRLCPIQPDCYAVLAGLFSVQGYPLKARKALLMANRSFSEGNFQPDVSTHGSPRRTIVLTLARTASFLFKHSFVQLGNACLELAISSENAVTAKATARGKSAMTVPHIRCLLKQAQALACMFDKNNTPMMLSRAADVEGVVTDSSPSTADSNDRVAQAVAIAQDGQLVAETPEDIVQAYCILAQAQNFAGVDQWQVIESYLHAITASKDIPVDVLTAENIIPLEAFIKAGKLLLLSGRYNETLTMLLYACKVYSSATLFMLLGVCCLRLDDLEDAEAALVEANLLDNRNSEIWAYLSLVCVSNGPHRIVEAERSLDQALRLGMDNVLLLRELATSFMSVDKLLISEELIRRAISLESAHNNNDKKGNARTRKLLADILAGQNQAAKAVDEYQAILGDVNLDINTKLEIADKCSNLLTTLGRDEELSVLKNIVTQLKLEQSQEQSNEAAPATNSPTNASQPVMM